MIAPRDYVLALVSGYPSPKRRLRQMLMLQAFIDDSGTEPPAFILAGYVGRSEDWATFSDEWQEILDLRPRIQYLKTKDAYLFHNEFAHWSKEARDEKLKFLLKVIKRHVMFGIVNVIPVNVYRSIDFRNMPGFDNPYFLGFFGIMISLMKHQRSTGIMEPVDFIFDEQGASAAEALQAYDAFRETVPAEFKHLLGGRPIHRDDLDLLPLQAADLLAWSARRHYAETLSREADFELPHFKYLNEIPMFEHIWDKQKLWNIANGIEGPY